MLGRGGRKAGGQELAAPAWPGSPKCSGACAELPGTHPQRASLCSAQRPSTFKCIHPEIFLWSQRITHTLKALISLAGQIVFGGFRTGGRAIASADCLGLFSDRKRRRAAGPMIRSVQTDAGNSKQISRRGMWIVCKSKTFACLCPANPGNSSECFNQLEVCLFPCWWLTINCKVSGFKQGIWRLWDSAGKDKWIYTADFSVAAILLGEIRKLQTSKSTNSL